jgi:hypothetical protein
MKKLWILITLFPSFIFSSVLFDPHMSPHAASEDLVFIFDFLEKRVDELVPEDYNKKHPHVSTLGRLIELSYGGTLAGLGSVTIHEVFGHGYRIRSLGSRKAFVNSYEINADSGATMFGIYPNLTTAEFTAITVAGIEAQEILAECTKRHWFLKGFADARQGRLYTMSRTTPLLYSALGLFDISNPEDLFGGHDIKAYVKELNLLYPGKHYTQSYINNATLLNLVDPTLYNSFYSFFLYLIKGKNAPLWSIRLGSSQYIPSLTTYLAPYGVEYGLTNILKQDITLYTFYIKGGHMGNRQYGGVGIEVMPLIRTRQVDLGFCADIWRQPLLSTPSIVVWMQETPAFTPLGGDRWGGRLGMNLSVNLKKNRAYQAIFQTGLKSQGYLPGYSLSVGPYIRGGALFAF